MIVTENVAGRSATVSPGEVAREQVRQRVAIWEACVGIVLLAVVTGMGRGPWEPDELKYAQIVQGMRAQGDFIVPHLWGTVYTDKPPLFFWLASASSSLFGHVSLAALLVPVVVSACVGVWLTSMIAAHWYGPRVGMLAAAVLVSMPLYLLMAQIGRMDMLLALSVTAAVHLCYLGHVQGRRWCKLAAFVAMAVGVLAKGPLGLVFPLAICGAFLTLSGRLRSLWCSESAAGVLVFVAMLASWLVPGVRAEGLGYLRELFGRQILRRALSGLSHAEPAYFYLWMLPILLTPWIVFLGPAVRDAWRRWSRERDPRDLWLLCWIVVPLVVLSLMREKLPVYLLPAIPPIAIVVARYWSELFACRGRFQQQVWRVTWLFLATCTAGLGLVGSVLFVHEDVDASRAFIIGGVLLTSFGLLGWLCARRRGRWQASRTFGMLVSAAPCAALFLTLVILPPLDERRSWREVGDSLLEECRPGERVVTYRLRPFVGYYVDSKVLSIRKSDELAALLESRGSACCVVRRKHLQELERRFLVEFTTELARPVEVVHLRPRSMVQTERGFGDTQFLR